MKHLYVLRHAKSSWDDPSLSDAERPLNKRGRRAADAMAGHLRDARVTADLVLCSPARRTRETLELVERGLSKQSVRIEPALYGADLETLLDLLRGLPGTLASVLVIGHNPGLQDLVLHLAKPGPSVRKVEAKFPTAALATLACPGEWSSLGARSAELIKYVRPRDL